ncbi:MAG: hypothetical protein MI746_10920 [Pseudomonadales bacterium]|nr:hypothetical protein [Pseudomonadales bacterium]
MKPVEFAIYPVKPLENLIDSRKHPAKLIGIIYFSFVLALFLLTDSFYPAGVELYGESPLEITGAALMMASLPAYLIMCSISSLRIRRRNHESISRLIEDPALHESIRKRGLEFWPLGILFGALNAGLNIPSTAFAYGFGSPTYTVGLVLMVGQILMWLIIGALLYSAILESLSLNNLSRHVQVNLYQLDELNGFGETALNSYLMIAGALALTTLQSLDLEFRWTNYRNGLIVGIPLALILVPLPIWNLHLRIRQAKEELVRELNVEINKASAALTKDSIGDMNALLQRRELIQNLRN